MSRSLPLVMLCALTASSCAEDLGSYTELEGLRVLAIQAEPPTLAAGETTTLSALVYQDAERDRAPTYQWSWCPFVGAADDGYPCRVTEAELAELVGMEASAISFDLGTSETASFTYFLEQETVTAACFSESIELAELFPECDGSLVIYIRLEVSDEEETLMVIKRVRLMTEVSEPNQNPTIGELSFSESEERWEDIPEDEINPIEPDGSTALHFQKEYQLRADVPEEASETFTGWTITDEGELVLEPTEEMLRLVWFVTAGDNVGFTQRDPPIEDWDDLELGWWHMPADDEVDGNQVQLFVVIHDERGGTSWTQRSIRLEDQP